MPDKENGCVCFGHNIGAVDKIVNAEIMSANKYATCHPALGRMPTKAAHVYKCNPRKITCTRNYSIILF